ncbi:MAG: hypothetical protein U0350_02365 [Caldilineaceae bacterium]
MRKFSSYGPIDTKLHYYAPRPALIQQAYAQKLGENPADGGHYITVWGPRQTGKTWVMQQVLCSFSLSKQWMKDGAASLKQPIWMQRPTLLSILC